MGWIGCVHCKKIRRDFVARTFYSSPARFAPSFVRQANDPEWTQIVGNAPKRQFWVQWSGSGTLVAKNSEATSWHELLHQSARFATSFVRQLNSLDCTQIVQNAPKHQFRVQWGGSGAFVAKNSDATCGTNFYTSSARFAPSFVRQPNGSEYTQMVRNALKCHFRFQWSGSGVFVAKKSNKSSRHEFLH